MSECFNVCPRCGQASVCPRSDDSERITTEWLEEEDMAYVVLQETDRQVQVELTFNNELVPSLCIIGGIVEFPLPHIKTRGQLRDLLAALGWSPPHDP